MAKKPNSMVFSGDIGGTKIRLGLWEVDDGSLNLLKDWTVASSGFSGLVEAINSVCRDVNFKGGTACFGVAGPVHRGISQLTNLPWVVDPRKVENDLGFERVVIINDIEATAWAVPLLEASSFHQVKGGTADHGGAAAIISVGTGLGQAGLVRAGESSVVFSGEGGHVDFAPQGSLERELQQYLADRYGHVSWERVLSGNGLNDLAGFFSARSGSSGKRWRDEMRVNGDPAAAIASAGMAGTSEVCSAALRLFVEILGAQAGNLAMTFLATGGVFLAGGIPPKILPIFSQGAFVSRFLDKGRMRHLLEGVPVHVIVDQDAPLKGAARRAAAELVR